MGILISTIQTGDGQRQALQDFVIANRDLTELELVADRFNIFEALGVVRNERKHSNFLAFLLDPKGNHGLSDRFLKGFLQATLEIESCVTALTPIDIALLDLSDVEIQVERNGIDIFIRDLKNKIFVIIENKVDSSEHSDQLAKYYGLVSKQYGRNGLVFGIFLTIDGEPPEREEDRKHYVPISHSMIRKSLDRFLEIPGIQIDDDVRFAIKQYKDVLGRHFMADEQIKELCEKIYRQHKKAIDLIIKNLPDQRYAIREKLIELVKANKNQILDDCTTTLVRFIPKALDISYFHDGWGWTSSKRFLLFEFQILPNSVVLVLQMGPGDAERRKYIHEFAQERAEVFQQLSLDPKFYEKWKSLYRKLIVEGFDCQGLMETIEAKWREFLEKDLPRIEETLLAHPWPQIPEKAPNLARE